jgi:aerobic carbon-monoxide dehydrogenase small subunit
MGMPAVAMTVNGSKVTGDVEGRTLLVDFLRNQLNLTGTHVGCDTSQCGACTVLVDGRAVKSCTVLAASCGGAEVTTIEGLARNAKLHPMQEAFREHHGLQCGFCTPGMLIVARDILQRVSNPDADTVRHELSGQICRCTGYTGIVKAIVAAGHELVTDAPTATLEAENGAIT